MDRLIIFRWSMGVIDPWITMKRNSAAIASILDPVDELSIKDSSNADDAVWYLGKENHHITGNLNLLADLMPVYDCWVRTLDGPPLQVFARGSVNHKGFALQDVWYVPELKANVVSSRKLVNLGLQFSVSDGTWEIKNDGVLVGRTRKIIDRLCELEFLNTISGVPWYIVSNATEHMTGDMFLLMDFTLLVDRPPCPDTHRRYAASAGQGVPSDREFSCP